MLITILITVIEANVANRCTATAASRKVGHTREMSREKITSLIELDRLELSGPNHLCTTCISIRTRIARN